MPRGDQRDYGNKGITISTAFLEHAKRVPADSQGPEHILWEGLLIATADAIPVPREGIVRGEVLSSKDSNEQGFDIKLDGWIELQNEKKVSLLRTWADPRYEPAVEYPFHSAAGQLWTWNVYKRRLPDGRTVVEKWTENAGLWVERSSDTVRVYHCSHGLSYPPDFESFVFKLTILPRR